MEGIKAMRVLNIMKNTVKLRSRIVCPFLSIEKKHNFVVWPKQEIIIHMNHIRNELRL